MKYNAFLILLYASLLLHLTACEETSEIKKQSSEAKTHAIIEKLSEHEFTYGDTLFIHGKNFGAKRGNHYIQMGDASEGDIQYLSWNDTLISIIVPKNIESGSIVIKQNVSNPYEFKVNKPFWLYIVDLLIKISLFVSLIYIYLKINKLWKRKHYKEVAESQSLAGLTIYILNCILWVVYYIMQGDINSMFDTSIYIFEGSILFLIGTGIFVKGQRRMGLWNLIRQSLRIERNEADYLLKRFFKPKHADIIINILHQLAMIDEELDVKELKIITMFAKEWNIEYSPEKLNRERLGDTQKNYIRLRNSIENYLAQEPPVEQVGQLKDLINELIRADEKVTKEEALISDEILPLLDQYLNKENLIKKFNVIIVPQKPEHETKIKELMPNSIKINTAGGIAYSIGTFYSSAYANMICQQFRKHKLFTIVHNNEEIIESNNE